MSEPIYRRIADDLRRQIESGALTAGSQLPTELELRDAYRASRNTIREALKWLISRGLVETRPGHGTFVAEKLEPFIITLSGDWQTDSGLGGGEGLAAVKEAEARGRKARALTPRIEVQLAERDIAIRLGVAEGATIISRHQERYIDDQPWSLQTSYYPMTLVERGASRLIVGTDIAEGAVKYLEEALQIKQVGQHDEIFVRPPDENESRFFRLPNDSRISVLVTWRTGFTDSPEGAAFRLTESIFPADRNKFIVNTGAVPGLPGGMPAVRAGH